MLDLSELNENQRTVANWDRGPLLLLAESEIEKSRALAYQIAQKFHAENGDSRILPFLGMTVSNKAANCTKLQVQKLLSLNKHHGKPFDISRLRYTTFHQYAERILHSQGSALKHKLNFTVLSEDQDRLLLLGQAIETEFPRNSALRSEILLPLVNRLIENDVAPDKAEQYLADKCYANPEIPGKIYQRYRSLMPEYNVYDYPTLISDLILLFETNPHTHGGLIGNYPYLCVDEIHNLTYAQYKLLRLMVGPRNKSLFLMADDKKIFDSWDGENVNRLAALQQDYDMEICRLPENQHCAPEIARASNKLIKHNFGIGENSNITETFKSNGNFSPIVFHQFDEFSDEADWIATIIADLDAESRNNCVVLAGSQPLLEQLAESLNEHGVNGFVPYGKGEFESTHMKWYLSVLKLAVSRIDSGLLQRVCKSFDTLCGISINYKDVIPRAVAEGSDYLRSWADTVLSRAETNAATRSMIVDALLPNLLDGINFKKFQKVAFKWLDELEFTTTAPCQVRENYTAEKAKWKALAAEISTQGNGEKISLHTLLREFDSLATAPPLPSDAVPCLKLDDSAGEGFDHVFVAGLMEGQSPCWEAIAKGDDSREIQEERRNLTATVSSAGKTLTLTCSDRLNGHTHNPSRFLQEIGITGSESSDSDESWFEEKMVATG